MAHGRAALVLIASASIDRSEVTLAMKEEGDIASLPRCPGARHCHG